MVDSNDLKNNGLKITFPRLKVLDVFRLCDTRHLSAEDVYRLLMADQHEIGLATVYRVLTQFEQAGLLRRVHFGPGKAMYELNDGEQYHGHIVCSQSGDVQEFHDPEIERRLRDISLAQGFSMDGYEITVFGTPVAGTPVAGR